MQLPKDPFMLLSFVNMKLRDYYPSLSAFCEDAGANEEELQKNLAEIGYSYDKNTNKFV